MAAQKRPTLANYLTQEDYTVGKKYDYDDHTFCGIMFNLKCRTLLPVNRVVLRSIAVRGGLGEMRVFVTKGGYQQKHVSPEEWQLVYHGKHESSMEKLVDMHFDNPVAVAPGDVLGVYVHCAEPGDDGVVYDNQRRSKVNAYSDNFIHITSGMADLSNEPFSDINPWGSYSSSWRTHRDFVGRIKYGVKYVLWNPNVHSNFPKSFRDFIRTMLLIDNRIKRFPKDVFLYILNMCHWSWAGMVSDADKQSEDDEVEEDVKQYWYRGNHWRPRRTIGSDDDDDEGDNDDDDDDDDEEDGQYFVVDAARLLLMQRMMGEHFPFVIPPGTGPGDRVVIRLPNRNRSNATASAGSSSADSGSITTSTEVTYDILYDDGDRERAVTRSRIKVVGETEDNKTADLVVDTKVMANWVNRGQYYPGKITAVNQPAGEGTEDASATGAGESTDDGTAAAMDEKSDAAKPTEGNSCKTGGQDSNKTGEQDSNSADDSTDSTDSTDSSCTD